MQLWKSARRILPVFYVLDTSGSMRGDAIECLNSAMEETIFVLKDLAAHNGDAQVRVAVLSFDSTVRWMQPHGPEDIEDFTWKPLRADGMTNMGAALRELNSKLSEDGFLRSASGSLLPVIIFMTDGYATDDYALELAAAMQNSNFRNATRVGFAIGQMSDSQMIASLTGDTRAVVQTNDLDRFAAFIRFVSETATTVASVTHDVQEENLGASIVAESRRMAGYGDEEITEMVVPPDVRSGRRAIWDMGDPT